MHLRQRHFIDSHKLATGLATLGLMAAYGAWDNTTAWLYLGLHGGYGVLWALKSRTFPDAQWEAPCSVPWGLTIWGALSLYLQIDTHINVPLRLPPGAFNPPPKVHSAIAHLIFQPPKIRIADQDIFDRLVRTMFSLRRKTLNNVLKAFDPAGPTVLNIAKIDPMRRPETLSLVELGHIVDLLAALKRPAVL